jgi:hypothetical protein
MKRKSILRVMLTIMVTFCFLLAGCKDSGGETVIPPPPLPPAEEFNTIVEFETWLEDQPANTAETPYTVKVNVSDLGSYPNAVGKMLKDNPTKYVNLDLSGSTLTTIGEGTFEGCPNLTGITIPNSVTTIGERAFLSCDSLTSVTIGSGVTTIGYSAFYGCSSLTSVTIPASVTSIGEDAFQGCSLTAITVDAANTAYSSQDGVLYNKNKTTLIQYPIEKTGATFIIPNSVTTIGEEAFLDCSSLTSVTFETGSNIMPTNFADNVFPEGDYGYPDNSLKTTYLAASPKAGTYTRAANGETWTKS